MANTFQDFKVATARSPMARILSDTAIAGLPPHELDALDDRYHWLDDT
ncbi:hypothetical protein AB0O34_19935 [Sphaerisporangium sp. NPDC088356]